MEQDNDDTFYKVTNRDIFNKLNTIENKLTATQNMAKKAMILSSTALTLALLVLGYFVSNLR